jgi:hypothetical protein
MSENMDTRLSKAEWRLEALESSQQRQDARMAALADRMETHHREVMGAIGSLRDERARQQGAAEARLSDAQKTRDRMKAVSLILGIIATLAALGWINTSRAAIVPTSADQPPIPTQHHTRELP